MGEFPGAPYAKRHNDRRGNAVLEQDMYGSDFWKNLADAISATATDSHIDRLIDMIGAVVPQNLITVTRYSATRKPDSGPTSVPSNWRPRRPSAPIRGWCGTGTSCGAT